MILECLYAYITRKNYSGECTSGDQIYTYTAPYDKEDTGTISLATDNLGVAARKIGHVGLESIDINDGVKGFGEKVEAPVDVNSYIYVPQMAFGDGMKSAVCCAKIRANLKNKEVRGTKELLHCVFFDSSQIEERNFYAIDCVASPYFQTHKGIELENSEEEGVCEVKPNLMPFVDINQIFSYNFSVQENSISDNDVKCIAAIFRGLELSIKKKRTLYIVFSSCENDMYQKMLRYLTITVKLFPPKVANAISFITCWGLKDISKGLAVDIRCIPTYEENFINQLKRDGYVVNLTSLGGEFLSDVNVDCGAFANFLLNTNAQGFKEWISLKNVYFGLVESISDMDSIVEIYNNRQIKDSKYTIAFSSLLAEFKKACELIYENRNLIGKMSGEIDKQLSSLETRLNVILAHINEIESEDIYLSLLKPLIQLLTRSHDTDWQSNGYAYIKNQVFAFIKYALFGKNPNESLLERHFSIVQRCFESVCNDLGDEVRDFIEYICRESTNINNFFKQYLDNPIYSDVAAEVILKLLTYLFAEFPNGNDQSSAVRDFLARNYLVKFPGGFRRLLGSLCSQEQQDHSKQVKYIFTCLLREYSSGETRESLINELCKFCSDKGMLEDAMIYLRDRFVSANEENSLINDAMNCFLQSYLTFEINDKDFNFIYKTYQKAKQYVEPGNRMPTIGLQMFVFRFWNDTIVSEKYNAAIQMMRFENMTTDCINGYEEMYKYLTRLAKMNTPANIIISTGLLEAIRKFIDDFNIFTSQESKSRELIEERVDFVARELSLLDNKTILKILDGYIDKEKFDGKLKDNNITNIDADRGVVEVAVEETKNYLRNDNESENKTELCRKVRKARVAKFVDYRVMIRDTINNFIGSCIFTAIIVAISALVSFLIYDHVANSYFKTIYIIFVAVIGIISELIYWFNFKDRRLRNVVVMSAWQMIFMIFGTIGIYTIMQVVLLSIGG